MGRDNTKYFIETIKKAIHADWGGFDNKNDKKVNYDKKVDENIDIFAEIDLFLELSSLENKEFDKIFKKSESDAKKESNGINININTKDTNYNNFRTIVNIIEGIITKDIIPTKNIIEEIIKKDKKHIENIEEIIKKDK